MDPTGPVAIGFLVGNFLMGLALTAQRVWVTYKQQKQIKAMNQQINTIKEAVVPQSDEELEREIDRVFAALTAAPTQELYQKTLSLMFKKRDSLLSKVDSNDIVGYINRCKVIAEQYENMFQKVEEILKDKGVVAAVVAGAGVGLDIATASLEQKGSAPRPIEIVQPKGSLFCC